ncbi:MAG: discoidin domain-containing protein [Candidatus Sumerlaeota bacterium]|nr:discoidin domain-containing protein [Candidatus Sumerlaeota bacterium]
MKPICGMLPRAAALVLLSLPGLANSAVVRMVDPAIDTTGPFCYLAKPNFNIGVMANRIGSQITFDGAIYSGGSELCFFYGSPLKPVMVRQKEILEGWMPIIHYSWQDGVGINYSIEAFAASLDGNPKGNLLNLARVTIRNAGTKPARASFAAASRFLADDHRFGRMKPYNFSPDWRYEMTGSSLWRDGKLIYMFPPGARCEAAPGIKYDKPFSGRELKIWEHAETGMAIYDVDLAPGQSRALIFKMPAHPVATKDARQIAMIRKADYADLRAKTIEFWRDRLARGAQFSIPEQKVQDTHRASLMYDWIAIWTNGKYWAQGVNKTQYNWFWLRDGAYIIRAYDMLGHHDVAEKCLEYFLTFQKPDGSFSSQKGQLDGFGQALFALGQHYFATGDKAYAQRVYKYFPPAIEWLKQKRAADQYHLLPPTEALDNEFISGRYTGHNFWALSGVRMAARMAQALGHESSAQKFRAEYDDYRSALMKRLDEVCGKDGPIPPGLDVPGGQQWGNLLGVYPSEVLAPDDARVSATLARMHREIFNEGVMTYMGQLHHYLTIKESQNHLPRNEQRQAVEDLYNFLLHTGSCNECFEWRTEAWGARDVGENFPPHGWGAAMYNAMLRNMLIREWGGDGGFTPRELHMFSAISPAWAVSGKEISIRKAPTEMGNVDSALRFTDDGAEFTFNANFRVKPECVILHIPYFVELVSCNSDAASSGIGKDAIRFSPDVKHATLKWRARPASKMTGFDSVVEQYKREYAKRYAAYTAAGNQPLPIEAPPMLSAVERERGFNERWSPGVVGIAVGKPVKVSRGAQGKHLPELAEHLGSQRYRSPTQGKHLPELAVDGNCSDTASAWWADGPAPRWLQVDLLKPESIGAIQVFPDWDDSRYYQYKVEVSLDGRKWKQMADMTKNTKPATKDGDMFRFDPLKARFVRVTMLRNSANPAVHLVEVRVFPAQK